MSQPAPLLSVRNLRTSFPIRRGIFRQIAGWVPAVDGISFTIHRGKTLALIGESGCGKTTAIRSIMRAVEPSGGEVIYTRNGSSVDVTKLSEVELRELWRDFRMLFQDPESSLNPRMTVRQIVSEPLIAHREGERGAALEARLRELMELVEMDPVYLDRYPYAFSGGQRQRIGIARALALNPSLILLDEPTSALDVSVQAQILNLLLSMQRDRGLTYIFVTHDLTVARHMSDDVAVMYLGKFVETGQRDQVLDRPLHPYTQALLASVPSRSTVGDSSGVHGEIPDPANKPPGCPFHPRCPHAQNVCRTSVPALREIEGAHKAACHFAGDLPLNAEA